MHHSKKTILKYALSKEIDSVVIAFSGSNFTGVKKNNDKSRYYYLNKERFYFDEGNKGIDYAIQSLNKLVVEIAKLKKVYLVVDHPIGHFFNPSNSFSGNRFTGIHLKENTVEYGKYSKNQEKIRNILINMSKEQ